MNFGLNPLNGGKDEARVSASDWQEGAWFIAQCLEIDVASQGQTEAEALANLSEDLELYFEPPLATVAPVVRKSRLKSMLLNPLLTAT
jgi:predicted RNase H-like HicB family nuclease